MITIDTTPDQVSSAYLENIWKVTSNRNDSASELVLGWSDNGSGFLRYTFASHTFEVGDVVLGAGHTTQPTYNVRQTVTAITGTTIDTNVAHLGGSAGTPTIARDNKNFQMRGDAVKTTGSDVSITAVADSDPLIDVTTGTAHGLAVDDYVIISNTTSYNGIFQVVAITSTTIFQVKAVFVATETGDVREVELIGSKRLRIDIVENKFIFDYQNLLESVVSFDLVTYGQTNIITPNDGSVERYRVLFREEFDDINGDLQDQGTLSSAAFEVANTIVQHEEVQDLDAFITESTSRRFLTDAPVIKNVFVGEEEQLSFLAAAGVTYKAKYNVFPVGGGAAVLASSAGIAISNNRGTVILNANHIATTVDKVEVWISDGADVRVSEIRTFKVIQKCFINSFRVAWVNRRGAIEHYTFTDFKTENVDSKKSKYTKNKPRGFTVEDRDVSTFGVSARNQVQVMSEFLTDAQADMLMELVTSPETRLIENSLFTPIDVLNSKEASRNDAGLKRIQLNFNRPELVIQRN